MGRTLLGGIAYELIADNRVVVDCFHVHRPHLNSQILIKSTLSKNKCKEAVVAINKPIDI